jgi:hypothetical protein
MMGHITFTVKTKGIVIVPFNHKIIHTVLIQMYFMQRI